VDIFTSLRTAIANYEDSIVSQGAYLASSNSVTGAVTVSFPPGFVQFVNKWVSLTGRDTNAFALGPTSGTSVFLQNTLTDALSGLDRVRSTLTEVMGYYDRVRNTIRVGDKSMAMIIREGLSNAAISAAAASLNTWYRGVVETSNMKFVTTRGLYNSTIVSEEQGMRARNLLLKYQEWDPDLNAVNNDGRVVEAGVVQDTIDPTFLNVAVQGAAIWGSNFANNPGVLAVNGEWRKTPREIVVYRDVAPVATGGQAPIFSRQFQKACSFTTITITITATVGDLSWIEFFAARVTNGVIGVRSASVGGAVTSVTITFAASFVMNDFLVLYADAQPGTAPAAATRVIFDISGFNTNCGTATLATQFTYVRPNGNPAVVDATSTLGSMWQATLGTYGNDQWDAYVRASWSQVQTTEANYIWSQILEANPGLVNKFATLLGPAVTPSLAFIMMCHVPAWFIFSPLITGTMKNFYTELIHAIRTWMFSVEGTDALTVIV
jgi:hypothetical protein